WLLERARARRDGAPVGRVRILHVHIEEGRGRRARSGAADHDDRVADAHHRRPVAMDLAGRAEDVAQELDHRVDVVDDDPGRDRVHAPILRAGRAAARLSTMKSVNGKICYIEIPATDIGRSSEFYAAAFGWKLRRRSDGALAFDDGLGEVSGTWVTGRPPMSSPGLLIYIMVDQIEATIDKITAAGGEIVQPVGADAPEITARFRDPRGNVLGLYQEPPNRE